MPGPEHAPGSLPHGRSRDERPRPWPRARGGPGASGGAGGEAPAHCGPSAAAAAVPGGIRWERWELRLYWGCEEGTGTRTRRRKVQPGQELGGLRRAVGAGSGGCPGASLPPFARGSRIAPEAGERSPGRGSRRGPAVSGCCCLISHTRALCRPGGRGCNVVL